MSLINSVLPSKIFFFSLQEAVYLILYLKLLVLVVLQNHVFSFDHRIYRSSHQAKQQEASRCYHPEVGASHMKELDFHFSIY